MNALRIFLILLAGLFLVAAKGTAPETVSANGPTVVGVDTLGTASYRIEGGPWTHFIQHAQITYVRAGTLRVIDRNDAVAVNLAIADVIPQSIDEYKYAQVISNADGRELTWSHIKDPRLRATFPMGELNHANPATWPESFRHDLLDPISVPHDLEYLPGGGSR